jgi:hypothetical protein
MVAHLSIDIDITRDRQLHWATKHDKSEMLPHTIYRQVIFLIFIFGMRIANSLGVPRILSRSRLNRARQDLGIEGT